MLLLVLRPMDHFNWLCHPVNHALHAISEYCKKIGHSTHGETGEIRYNLYKVFICLNDLAH